MKPDDDMEISAGLGRGRFLREFYTPEIEPLIENLIVSIEDLKGFHLVKDDCSTTVGYVEVGAAALPFDLFIKRFNCKGRLRAVVRGLFLRPRAETNYLVNRRFLSRGIRVPLPIGFIEMPAGGDGFYLSKCISDAMNLGVVFKTSEFGYDPGVLASTLGETLARWHAEGVVHGDLKWSNILMRRTGSGPEYFLVDMDRAALHARPAIKGIKRDLVRFVRYGMEVEAGQWVEKDFLPVYMESLPASVRSGLDFQEILRSAEGEFQRKSLKTKPS